MKAVNTQLQRIHILLSNLGKLGVKGDYVIDITDGREHSTKELTFDEANILIKKLEDEQREQYRLKQDTLDVMRKGVISKMKEMGALHNTGKANMAFIYRFIERYFKKELNKASKQELAGMIHILKDKWLPWYYRKRKEDANFSILNLKLDESEKTKQD